MYLDNELSVAQSGVAALAASGEKQIADAKAASASLSAQIDMLEAEVDSLTARLAGPPRPPSFLIEGVEFYAWKKNVGPGIGGVAPLDYNASYVDDPFPVPGTTPAKVLRLIVVGALGKFSDWLASHMFSGVVPPQMFSFEYEFAVDANFPVSGQAAEGDTLLVLNGKKYNWSCQYLNQRGGVIQIWDPTANANHGTWVDSGIVIGPIAPGVYHKVRWDFSYDPVAFTYRYLGFWYDGTFHDLSQTAPRPALDTNWGEGLMPQLQPDADGKQSPTPEPGEPAASSAFAAYYKNARYIG